MYYCIYNSSTTCFDMLSISPYYSATYNHIQRVHYMPIAFI